MKAFDTILRDHDNFAGFNLADKFCPDNVECDSFRTKDRGAVNFTQNKRANTQRVPRADQLFVGKGHERIRTLNLSQCLHKTVHRAVMATACHQLQNNLRVGG